MVQKLLQAQQRRKFHHFPDPLLDLGGLAECGHQEGGADFQFHLLSFRRKSCPSSLSSVKPGSRSAPSTASWISGRQAQS